MKIKSNSELVNKFAKYTKDPTAFLSVQTELECKIKPLLKQLYDLTKQTEDVVEKDKPTLPNLVIKDFDTEQIWQQIELQNQFIADKLSSRFTEYVSNNNVVPSDNDEDSQDEIQDEENGSDNDSSDDEDDVDIEEDGDPTSIDEEDLEEEEIEDDGLENGDDDDDEDDAESDESIDYFQDIPSDDENKDIEKSEENEKKFGPMYNDFFEDPKVIEEKQQQGVGKKRVKFDLDDDDVEESDHGEEDENSEFKSTFEMRQERLRQRVDQLENEALSEKPWHMIGEVNAKKRPQNSLLEQNLEFDFTVRPAPIITEEVALKLEDIIIQRVKDKAWDDVERKIKPVDAPLEFRKKIVLNQEKSKLSLAQVYEQEYLKQKEAVDGDKSKVEEEPKEHKHLKALMNSLFLKLDALSNYHYTPRPAAQEIQIITNLPALSMEEAIPVTVSNAALAAPEEVLDKKSGDLVGKEERSSTDKKRARRRKKVKQREKYKNIENKQKLLSKLKPGMAQREKLKKDLEKMAKNKTLSHFKEDTDAKQSTKSSTKFFEKLQDTVTNKDKVKKRKKDSNHLDAKKIKL
ncbi:U3 small nucleolar ribonucleoprotein protein MPP10 [Planococcus citri]|uniref:U3 small nucleolar ribonucleoprotein protein MPP10 n=1 Tax=Planococcus citri TaxID=170843 RepID=UPI0031F8C273